MLERSRSILVGKNQTLWYLRRIERNLLFRKVDHVEKSSSFFQKIKIYYEISY